MGLSIEQSAAFVAVAETGSIRDAARQLGKAASTVSNLISYLEIELDQLLFVRHARSVEITQGGKELLDYARSVIAESEIFKAKAHSISSGIPNRLRVAVDTGLWCDDVSACFKGLSDQFPSPDLRIQGGDALQVQEMVLSQQADLALRVSSLDFPKGLAHVRSFNFMLTMVARPDHPLCQGPVKLEVLRRHTQILYRPLSVAGLDKMQKLGHHVIEASTLSEIRELAAAGLGWAYLAKFQLGDTLEKGKLQELQFAHGKLRDDWRTDVIWHENRVMDPAIKWMIRALAGLQDR